MRLHGDVAITNNAALAEHVGKLASFDAAPFVRVVRHVRGEQKLDTNEVDGVLAGYLRGMNSLVAHLDQYQPAG